MNTTFRFAFKLISIFLLLVQQLTGYHIEEGRVHIPDAPGFGLLLDDEIFMRAVAANGYAVIGDW